MGWARREFGSEWAFQQQLENLCKDTGSGPALDLAGLAAPIFICCYISRAVVREARGGWSCGHVGWICNRDTKIRDPRAGHAHPVRAESVRAQQITLL